MGHMGRTRVLLKSPLRSKGCPALRYWTMSLKLKRSCVALFVGLISQYLSSNDVDLLCATNGDLCADTLVVLPVQCTLHRLRIGAWRNSWMIWASSASISIGTHTVYSEIWTSNNGLHQTGYLQQPSSISWRPDDFLKPAEQTWLSFRSWINFEYLMRIIASAKKSQIRIWHSIQRVFSLTVTISKVSC